MFVRTQLRVGLLVTLSGCALVPEPTSSAPPPMAVFQVPIVIITCRPQNRGTATRIGERRYATCRHVLPKEETAVLLNGHVLPVTQVASGNPATAPAEDWVVFDIPAVAAAAWPPKVRVDFDHPLEIGERVWIIGYGWSEDVANRITVQPSRARLVAATVARPVEAALDLPRLISLECTAKGPLRGLSGAPVIAYDAERDQAVICGLVVDSRTYSMGSDSGSEDVERRTAVRPLR